jgi:outer membrane protein OmpA-like peptidoglycan-associated protein
MKFKIFKQLSFSRVFLSVSFLFSLTFQNLAAADNFSSTNGLSDNQRNVANIFDALSSNPNTPTSLKNLLNDAKTKDSSIRNLLSQTAGYFLANVVGNIATENFNKEIYKNFSSGANIYKEGNIFWTQMLGNINNYGKDENSIDSYNNNGVGLMFGTQGYVVDNVKIGIFGEYIRNDIKQGKNKADIDNFGGGIYGGYITDNVELRSLVFGKYSGYSTHRYIDYTSDYLNSNNVDADFSSLTLGADIEFSYKCGLDLKNFFSLRPFTGLDISYLDYTAFNESGNSTLGLNVHDGNHLRSSFRFGGEVKYDAGKIWIFYAEVETRYIIAGVTPEITAAFKNTRKNYLFTSEGFKETPIIAGIGMGAEARVTNGLNVFANASYQGGSEYSNFLAITGVKYKFGQIAAENVISERTEPLNYVQEVRNTDQENNENVISEERIEPLNCIQEYDTAPAGQENYEDIAMTIAKAVIGHFVSEDSEIFEEEKVIEPPLSENKFALILEHFAVGKSELNDKTKSLIKEICDKIKADDNKIHLTGYANDGKTFEENQEIAYSRAKAVFNEFVVNGIPASCLFIETRPHQTEEDTAFKKVEVFVNTNTILVDKK